YRNQAKSNHYPSHQGNSFLRISQVVQPTVHLSVHLIVQDWKNVKRNYKVGLSRGKAINNVPEDSPFNCSFSKNTLDPWGVFSRKCQNKSIKNLNFRKNLNLTNDFARYKTNHKQPLPYLLQLVYKIK